MKHVVDYAMLTLLALICLAAAGVFDRHHTVRAPTAVTGERSGTIPETEVILPAPATPAPAIEAGPGRQGTARTAHCNDFAELTVDGAHCACVEEPAQKQGVYIMLACPGVAHSLNGG